MTIPIARDHHTTNTFDASIHRLHRVNLRNLWIELWYLAKSGRSQSEYECGE
jgi:hypothetical protein